MAWACVLAADMPTVNLYATFRDVTGHKRLETPGSTVAEVLDWLVGQYPVMLGELFENGTVAERVSIFISGRDVRYHGGLEAPVSADTIIDLFPPVAGGNRIEQVFGGMGSWLVRSSLLRWGGSEQPDGSIALEGAKVWINDVDPLSVGKLVIQQVKISVEGPEAQRWMQKITLSVARGGG